jgi:hypothetical protein
MEFQHTDHCVVNDLVSRNLEPSMRSPPRIISVRVPRSGLTSSMEANNPSAQCNKIQISNHSIHFGRTRPLSEQGRGCGFEEHSAIAMSNL